MADIINYPGVHVDPKTVDEYQKAVLDRVEAEKEKYGVNEDSPKEDQGVDSRFVHECLLANELGDGMLYKPVNSDHLVFNKSMGEWLWWTGHHWSVDKMGRSHAAVERVVEAYLAEAARLSHKMKDLDGDKAAEIKQKYYEHQRKEIFSRVQKLRGRTRKNNCIDGAHNCNDPLAIDGTNIDSKPYPLACKNGVVNLKTGELEPGRRSDYLMKSSPIEWQGLDSPCPLWERTLLEIFDGNNVKRPLCPRFWFQWQAIKID
jgi:putative DNA primase/helicase